MKTTCPLNPTSLLQHADIFCGRSFCSTTNANGVCEGHSLCQIKNWDPVVTNAMSGSLAGLFENCLVENSAYWEGIELWDTSLVTNMQSMFENASDFNAPIGNWDVNNVMNFNYMFDGAVSFDQNLAGWEITHDINDYLQSLDMFENTGLSNCNKKLIYDSFANLNWPENTEYDDWANLVCPPSPSLPPSPPPLSPPSSITPFLPPSPLLSPPPPSPAPAVSDALSSDDSTFLIRLIIVIVGSVMLFIIAYAYMDSDSNNETLQTDPEQASTQNEIQPPRQPDVVPLLMPSISASYS